MRAPILFILRGPYAFLLPFALWQAHVSNPSAPIVLISDRRPAGVLDFVTWVDLAELMPAAAAFRAAYLHLSTHSVSYERFCFERWFVLLRYLQAQHIDRC